MAVYQIKLEKEQLLLSQYVDIGTELFAMASSLSRAEFVLRNNPHDTATQEMTDLICQSARRRIAMHFNAVRCNDTRLVTKVSRHLLAGQYDWMMSGIVKP